ncbi:MAG TPA: capsid cement protein [Thermomicrobiales bacterium]|nr:capsid cement protein [Thermomicrobiales bacterium]
MSQFCNGNTKSFVAGGAISQYARVKLSSGKLALAGAADVEIGVVETAAFADGDLAPVRLRTAAGTFKMIAGAAIAAGAEVYAAASGEVGTTNTNPAIGHALDAASGANSIIEVLRL